MTEARADRRRVFRAIRCGGLALLLAACAVRHPPETSQVVKESLPPATKIPGSWTSPGADSASVQAGWLRTFNDPQMEAIVAESLQNNLSLQAALTRIDVAANIVAEAYSQLLPLVAVQGAASMLGRFDQKNFQGQPKGRFNTSSLLGVVSWEVDLWGRIRAQVAAARQSLAATEADVQWGRESLAALTAKVWYLATYTQQLVKFAERNVQITRQNLDLLQVKRTVGEVSDLDVDLANADLKVAQFQTEQIRNSYQQTVRGLEVLLGRYPSAELQVATTLAALPPPVPAGLPAQLLERRPDVIAAERTFDTAFHLVQSAKAARLPAISLTAASGYMTNDLFQLLRLRPWILSGAANLLAPLYTGGYLQAQVKAANDNQKAALALYGQTALQAFSDVEVSLANEASLKDQQQDLAGALKDTEDALSLARIKFQIGETDMQPVPRLESAVLGAQTAVTGLQFERLAARIDLHLALGGGF